jgi:ABC-type Zn uptake system ZnuABC Zn-binding protein ZnuA
LGLRLSCVVGVLAAALLLSGCATSLASPQTARPQVVTTIGILADFVTAVAGERVEVISIIGAGGDPHGYEPVPSDAARLNDADLIVRNGLGLEPGLDRLIAAAGPQVMVLTVADGADGVASSGGRADPHLWMDPVHAAGYVERIRDALMRLLPDEVEGLEADADAYLAELDALDARIFDAIAALPQGQRQLVTTHDAFRYFGDRYDLSVVGTIWGVSTEREPSASEIRGLVDTIRRQGVAVVFVETTVNPKLMRQVADDAGVRVGDPLYGDALGPAGSGADTYIGMMDANTEAIVTGLSHGATR